MKRETSDDLTLDDLEIEDLYDELEFIRNVAFANIEELFYQVKYFSNNDTLGKLEPFFELLKQKLQNLSSASKTDSTKLVDLIIDYYYALFYKGRWEKLEVYLNQALKVCQETEDITRQARVWSLIGTTNQFKGNREESQFAFQKSLELSESIDDLHSKSNSLFELGGTETNKSNYKRAIEYFEESLNIKRTLNKDFDIAVVLIGLGYAYAHLNNSRIALSSFEEALNISLKIGSQRLESQAQYGIGFVALYKLLDTASAFNAFTKVSKLMDVVSDAQMSSRIQQNLGQIAIKRNDLVAAQKHLLEAYEIANNIDFKSGKASIMVSLAELNILRKDYKQAFESLEFSLQTALTMEHSRGIIRIARLLSPLYLRQFKLKKLIKLGLITLKALRKERITFLQICQILGKKYESLFHNRKVSKRKLPGENIKGKL